MPFRNSTLSISVLLLTLILQSVGCERKEEPVSISPSIAKRTDSYEGGSGSSALPSGVQEEGNQTSPILDVKEAERRFEAANRQARAAEQSRSQSAAERPRSRESAASERSRELALRKETEVDKAGREIERQPAMVGRETASLGSGPKPDAFAAIDEAIQQMEKANIAFNAPKTMNRADTVMIQLLLSMNEATEDLTKLLKGKGEKQSAVVSVAGIMEARLSGPNFEITATTPEEQPISRLERTEWRWDVKSKSVGEHDLHLTLTAIFDVEGTQRKRAIRTFDQIITVNVTTSQKLADFVSGNWQWLWAAIAVPLGGAIWQRKRTQGKRKKR